MDFFPSNWQHVLTIGFVINIAAFLIFGFDKFLAKAGLRRVSERDLLVLALLGGALAIFGGRYVFRHKTRKQPFNTNLKAIMVLQAVLLFGFIVFLILSPSFLQF